LEQRRFDVLRLVDAAGAPGGSVTITRGSSWHRDRHDAEQLELGAPAELDDLVELLGGGGDQFKRFDHARSRPR